MRSLIVGATGLVGSHLAQTCTHRGLPHLGTGYRRPKPDHVPLDVRDTEAVADLIADYQPDVTFLAAGSPCGRFAESHPAETAAVHTAGTAAVAEAVAAHGGTLVYFSCDDLFGDCFTARREDDLLEPTTALGRAKVAAENAVRATLPGRHLIVRSSWVFGAGRGQVGRWVRAMGRGETVDVCPTAFGQPTYAADLANAVVTLAEQGHTGTVHAVGPDRHTEATFARLVAHLYGFDVDLVRETAEASGRAAKVWLDRFAFRKLAGPRAIRPVGDGLRAMRDAGRTPAVRLVAA